MRMWTWTWTRMMLDDARVRVGSKEGWRGFFVFEWFFHCLGIYTQAHGGNDATIRMKIESQPELKTNKP